MGAFMRGLLTLLLPSFLPIVALLGNDGCPTPFPHLAALPVHFCILSCLGATGLVPSATLLAPPPATIPSRPPPLYPPRDDAGLCTAFRAAFPTMDVAAVEEGPMKSTAGKAAWRAFLEGPAKSITPDYAFGTLLRLSATGGYTPENTILVSRGVFYAVEAARNAEGVNDGVDFGALA